MRRIGIFLVLLSFAGNAALLLFVALILRTPSNLRVVGSISLALLTGLAVGLFVLLFHLKERRLARWVFAIGLLQLAVATVFPGFSHSMSY